MYIQEDPKEREFQVSSNCDTDVRNCFSSITLKKKSIWIWILLGFRLKKGRLRTAKMMIDNLDCLCFVQSDLVHKWSMLDNIEN